MTLRNIGLFFMAIAIGSQAYGQKGGSRSKKTEKEFEIEWSSVYQAKKNGYPMAFKGINSNYVCMSFYDKKKGDKIKGYNYLTYFDKRSLDFIDEKPVFFYGPKRLKKNKAKKTTLTVNEVILFEKSVAIVYDEAKKGKNDRRGTKTKHRFFVDRYNLEGDLIESGKPMANNIQNIFVYKESGFLLAVEKDIAREKQSNKEFRESKPTYKVHVYDTLFNEIYSTTFRVNEMRKYVTINDIEPIHGDTPSVAVSISIFKNDGKKEERKNREFVALVDHKTELIHDLPFVQKDNLTLEPSSFVIDPGITRDSIHGLAFADVTKAEQGKKVAKATAKALKSIRDNFYAIYYNWNTIDDTITAEVNLHPIYTNPINYNYTLTKKQNKYERRMEKSNKKRTKKVSHEYDNQFGLRLAAILQSPNGNYYRFYERRYEYEVCTTDPKTQVRRCYWVYVMSDIYVLEADKTGKANKAYKFVNHQENNQSYYYPPHSFTPIISPNGRPTILMNRPTSGSHASLLYIELGEKSNEAYQVGIMDKSYRMPQVNWLGSNNYDRKEGKLYFIKVAKKKKYRFGVL